MSRKTVINLIVHQCFFNSWYSSHAVGHLYAYPPSKAVPHAKNKKMTRPLPLIHSMRSSLPFVRGRVPIPGSIRSLPALAVYDVCPFFRLKVQVEIFPFFKENETLRFFSYLSADFREQTRITSKKIVVQIILDVNG